MANETRAEGADTTTPAIESLRSELAQQGSEDRRTRESLQRLWNRVACLEHGYHTCLRHGEPSDPRLTGDTLEFGCAVCGKPVLEHVNVKSRFGFWRAMCKLRRMQSGKAVRVKIKRP